MSNFSENLPKNTKEFAQWLRSIADQVDRIPVCEVTMREDDVEVGFYYANPMFPQMPMGIHFQVEVTTYQRRIRRGGDEDAK